MILSQPKRYALHVFLPSFLSYVCKYAVVGIFLAAFAIPVTFESITWVIGSGSLANVVSVTPGAVGITQATNALALNTCCHVPNDTSVAYSTAQQLVTTAWNILFAVILVVCVFGWTGGKQLIGLRTSAPRSRSRSRRRRAGPELEKRKAEKEGERERTKDE